ncbi:phosphatidylethanolamine-binding protein (PEBP) family [Ceratobasidium sp. AG-Ba]|nr:phosphatidylethanolamine-binding protein (PEBP) family [Ceratobasidium sp. AG-Ba]
MLWASLLTISLSLSLVASSPVKTKCYGYKAHSRPTLAEVKHSFKEAKIVPDLLPIFKPSSLLYLSYPKPSAKHKSKKSKKSKTVLPGKKFAKDVTEAAPEISIKGPGWPGAYVFFLLDPDAPSNQDPKWAQVRHMFMGNLTLGGFSKHVTNAVVLTNQTVAVNDYMPPAPPAGTGPHRYVALLYAQPPDFNYSFLDTSERKHFNITKFSKKSGLGTPLAGTFMTVKIEDDDEDEDTYWLPVVKQLLSHWQQIVLKMLF